MRLMMDPLSAADQATLEWSDSMADARVVRFNGK
jgi:hypothetical protein